MRNEKQIEAQVKNTVAVGRARSGSQRKRGCVCDVWVWVCVCVGGCAGACGCEGGGCGWWVSVFRCEGGVCGWWVSVFVCVCVGGGEQVGERVGVWTSGQAGV